MVNFRHQGPLVFLVSREKNAYTIGGQLQKKSGQTTACGVISATRGRLPRLFRQWKKTVQSDSIEILAMGYLQGNDMHVQAHFRDFLITENPYLVTYHSGALYEAGHESEKLIILVYRLTSLRQLESISSHARLYIAGYLKIQPFTHVMEKASLGATETTPLEQSIRYCFSASSTALQPEHLRRAAAAMVCTFFFSATLVRNRPRLPICTY